MKRARATREDGRGFDAREAMRAWTRGARETTREATLRAFHGGDVTKILRECRDGSNEAYDDDDVEAAMEAHEYQYQGRGQFGAQNSRHSQLR